MLCSVSNSLQTFKFKDFMKEKESMTNLASKVNDIFKNK